MHVELEKSHLGHFWAKPATTTKTGQLNKTK